MGELSISLRNVSKSFKIHGKKKGLLNAFKQEDKRFVALDDISFDVKKGEVLGIIGRNGSGKSTLLSIIAGIMPPDSGKVDVHGKVASILELGMGFHGDLSGRENIRIKGAMYGFTDEDIDNIIDYIIDYSGLGEKIDDPVRTYSSGMSGRLAYSIMVNVRADIMLVDEVLSTGDAEFAAKANAHLTNLAKSGVTVILVTHSLNMVEDMCQRAIWIDHGKMREQGQPRVVCGHYKEEATESFDVLETLAAAGSPVAQTALGCRFRDGVEGIEQDLGKAYSLFNQAASLGYDKAQIYLGDMLYSGEGCKPDRHRALELYRKAAVRGNNEAKIKMGSLYSSEKIDGKDEAIDTLLPCAESGDVRAARELADMLLRTAWTFNDKKLAFYWYKKAASLGDSDAMYQAGIMLRDGNGTSRDFKKALNYFKSAAESGNLRSKQYLADIYYDGIKVERDPVESFKWYESAVESGWPPSYFRMALMEMDGDGTQQDEEDAIDKFRIVSNRPMVRTEAYLANAYGLGTGVESNQNKSLKWFLKAAENDDRGSCFRAANILRDGRCGETDIPLSIKLLHKASRLGDGGSNEALLRMGAAGIASERDIESAKKKLYEMCEKKDTWAIHTLGNVELTGIGCDNNPEKAFELFKNGSDLGRPASISKMSEMLRDGIGTKQDLESAASSLLTLGYNGDVGATERALRIYAGMEECSSKLEDCRRLLEGYARGGNGWACLLLGNIYSEGILGEVRAEEAFDMYSLATDLGNLAARVIVGDRLRDGFGTVQDLEKASQNYMIAAKCGNINGLINFANLSISQNDDEKLTEAMEMLTNFANGGNARAASSLANICVERGNRVEGLKWHEKAATLGNIGSAIWAGKEYREGNIVEKNIEKALIFFRMAMCRGNPPACVETIITVGNTTEGYGKEAFDILIKLAKGSNIHAMNTLGTLFFEGKLVEKDLIKSREFYSKSAAMGHGWGKHRVGEIDKILDKMKNE